MKKEQSNWVDLDRYVWHPFTSLQDDFPILPIERAAGAYLYTPDGRKILDAISSWWVNLHGHSHPRIVQALRKQIKILDHIMFAGLTHKAATTLAQRILQKLPAGFGKVFFSDNGSTAVEVAVKVALQYWHNQGVDKKRIIAIRGGYHGDTFGGMSVADRTLFNAAFHDKLFEVDFIDFPTKENVEAVFAQQKKYVESNKVAAFIFEPLVQGVAGMRMYAADWLNTLLSIAKKKEVICIADEVLTGFGRTGKWFASDHLTEIPDIIALSKGITGGVLPLGLTAFQERIVYPFQSNEMEKTFFHGHSYTANPLACAAAHASLSLMEQEKTWQHIGRIARGHKAFAEKIQRKYGDKVRIESTGVILACTVRQAQQAGSGYGSPWRMKMYKFFMERNILVRPLGNVLYILPPYIIDKNTSNTLYQSIEDFVETVT